MQDFGKIKTVFNNILIEGIVKKDNKSKKLFQKYLKTIKESEILTTEFLVYNNIETMVDKDFNSAALYLNENINLLKKYAIQDIVKENKKLADLLGEGELDKVSDTELYNALSHLILTKPTASNVSKATENLKIVINHITSNQAPVVQEAVNLPNSMLMNLMVQKYNEKYSELLGEDKDLLSVLLNADTEQQKEFYNKKVNECVQIVDNLLKNESLDSREKLVKVKAKLQENVDVTEQFSNKIIKLIELKNNLLN